MSAPANKQEALEALEDFRHECLDRARAVAADPSLSHINEKEELITCKEALAHAGRDVRRDRLLIRAAELLDDLTIFAKSL